MHYDASAQPTVGQAAQSCCCSSETCRALGCAQMRETAQPAFRVMTPEGHVYSVWADGRVDGFPAGSLVYNGIARLLAAAAPAYVFAPTITVDQIL